MKEFFLILFFAKVITLTNEPIDIDSRANFDFKEPVSAITSGAHIRIDVTDDIKESVDLSDSVSVLEVLRLRFPDGTITAILTTPNGEQTILDNISGSTNGEVSVLVLSSASGVPTDVKYSKLEIHTSRKLTDVFISWQNYSK